jgi:hypothetical protein
LSGIGLILKQAAGARFGALSRAVAARRASLAIELSAVVVEPFAARMAFIGSGVVIESAGRTIFAAACVDDVIESAGRTLRAVAAALRCAVRSWGAFNTNELTAVTEEPFVA